MSKKKVVELSNYRKPLDPHICNEFYQKALGFEKPFTLKDVVGPGAIPERLAAGSRWLQERVTSGELKRTKYRHQNFYEWIN